MDDNIKKTTPYTLALVRDGVAWTLGALDAPTSRQIEKLTTEEGKAVALDLCALTRQLFTHGRVEYRPTWWRAARSASPLFQGPGKTAFVEALALESMLPGASRFLCAQCVLTGKGAFVTGKDGKCPNPSCDYSALRLTNTNGDKKPAAETAPEGALPAKSCAYDQDKPAARRAKGKNEYLSTSAKGGTLRTSTREASKTDEWEALQKALCESCASAVAHWPSVQSSKPTTKELIEGEVWPTVAGRVFTYLENGYDDSAAVEFHAGLEVAAWVGTVESFAGGAGPSTIEKCEAILHEEEEAAAAHAAHGRWHTAAGAAKVAWARYAGNLFGFVQAGRQPNKKAWAAIGAALLAKCFAVLELRAEHQDLPLFKNKTARNTWVKNTVESAARDLWTAPEGGANA